GQAARSIEVVRSDGLRITLAEQRRTLWQEVLRARVAYLSLLPLFLALGIFVYFPPLSAMYHAFFDWNPSGQSTFVGLGNFQTMLSDNVLASSFWNLAKLLVFAIVVTVTVPLIVAEMIYAVRNNAAQYFYRVVFLIPVVVPVGIVQGFQTQLILTDGGPGWATEVPGLRMYQTAFEGSRFGYASAIGLVLFLIVLVLTIINFRFIRPSTEFEGHAM